jgi:hypothetical protein
MYHIQNCILLTATVKGARDGAAKVEEKQKQKLEKGVDSIPLSFLLKPH